jgi:dUTP pyrophosphatase
VEAFSLAPGERRMVPTGIAVALPPGVCGLVLPRSGLAARFGVGVVNGPGLIDPNYRGEVNVVLINHGDGEFSAAAGDRIAQLLLVPFSSPPVEVVEELSETERGTGGFGSSGR